MSGQSDQNSNPAQQPVNMAGDNSTGNTQTPAASQSSPLDILNLPDEQRQVMSWIIRQGHVTLAEIATHLEQPPTAVQNLLDQLIQQGLLRFESGTDCYCPNLHRRPRRSLGNSLWQKLDGG